MPILDGFEAGAKIREYINSTNLASVVSVNKTPLSPNKRKEEEHLALRGSSNDESDIEDIDLSPSEQWKRTKRPLLYVLSADLSP